MTFADMNTVTSIDVERRARFLYAVILRRDNGLDTEFDPPCRFKWTAMRLARKLQRKEYVRRSDQQIAQFVARLSVDRHEPYGHQQAEADW